MFERSVFLQFDMFGVTLCVESHGYGWSCTIIGYLDNVIIGCQPQVTVVVHVDGVNFFLVDAIFLCGGLKTIVFFVPLKQSAFRTDSPYSVLFVFQAGCGPLKGELSVLRIVDRQSYLIAVLVVFFNPDDALVMGRYPHPA